MVSSPMNSLGLSCPLGGKFYICQGNTTQFIGCCTSNPCTEEAEGDCPQDDLRYSSFHASVYGDITTQACVSSNKSDAQWFTCSSGEKGNPFMGCCSSNACSTSDGCSTEDLRAARLSDNAKSAAVFETTAKTSSSTRTSSSTKIVAITSAVSTSTTASVPNTTTPSSTAAASLNNSYTTSTGLSTGAKAGIGIGCMAAIALVAVVLFSVKRCIDKRKGVVVRGSYPPSPSNGSPMDLSSRYYDPNQIMHSPPERRANPFTSILGAKSPPGYEHSISTVSSSPSIIKSVSRETSFKQSTSTTNGLGIMLGPSPLSTPTSTVGSDRRTPYFSGWTRKSQHGPLLAIVSELDGTDVPLRPSPARSPAPQYRAYYPGANIGPAEML